MEEVRALKSCNICGSSDFSILHHYPKEYYDHNKYITHSWDGGLKIDLQIVKCKNCGLVYQNPCFNELGMKYLYPENSIPDKLDYKSLMSDHGFRFLIENVINKFYPAPLQNTYSVVDIGTRFGVLPELLAQRGFKAFGIEYNLKSVQSAKTAGFKYIHQGTIKDLRNICIENHWGTINLVILIDVIEHLLDPSEDFKTIAQFQKEGDRILIQTPNLDSLGYQLFKSDWYYIHSQHTYYFNEHSIRLLFAKLGYEIEYVFQIPKIKNLRILPKEIIKYIKHKMERYSGKNKPGKKWFATNRPALLDEFTIVLKKK